MISYHLKFQKKSAADELREQVQNVLTVIFVVMKYEIHF
jgi:hypothetical protein